MDESPRWPQMPGVANLGLNNVSHALPLGPGAGLQSTPFVHSGAFSAHGMPLQAPAQMAPPQAYAQVRVPWQIRVGCRGCCCACHVRYSMCAFSGKDMAHRHGGHCSSGVRILLTVTERCREQEGSAHATSFS